MKHLHPFPRLGAIEAELYRAADEHNKLVSDLCDLFINLGLEILRLRARVEVLERERAKFQ